MGACTSSLPRHVREARWALNRVDIFLASLDELQRLLEDVVPAYPDLPKADRKKIKQAEYRFFTEKGVARREKEGPPPLTRQTRKDFEDV